MNVWRLIAAGVRYYWSTHLGVVLGAALGAMVLTGSLLVGDSVKATLLHQAALRVGKVNSAMVSNERFFREQLAAECGPGAPVLMLRGSVAKTDGSARVNQAQVLGVDERFFQLAPGGPVPQSVSGAVAWVNGRLAENLHLTEGDTLIIRIEKPGMFSRDAPLSGEENEVVALRVKVASTLTDAQFGRFSLQAGQVPPFSVFVPLRFIQERLAMKDRANLLLAGAGVDLSKAVSAHWQLEDAGLEFRALKSGGVELRTGRVFLEAPVVAAAPKGVDALTYLVNELRSGQRATPYSMVTALDAAASGFIPAELADGEIVINQWLANDLGIHAGDPLTMKYFVMGERRQLEERSREFTVLSVLPMDEPQLNGSWMPDFPGLSDRENCREWQPGFDIDVSRFRPADEDYWDRFRGTPKAFINIETGRQLWANRWGDLTAIRYPDLPAAQPAAALRAKLQPAQVGMSFLALREAALAATRAPVDFGELFVSFSVFLIAAAAVLTGLLFVFSIEQRQAETGLLLAVGWRPAQVRRVFLFEGAALALAGSLLGAGAALLYTKLVLRALGTVWRGAVGTMEFVFSPNPLTLGIGVFSGVAVALLAMWLVSRRQFRHSARELLGAVLETGNGSSAGKVKLPLLGAGVCLLLAAVMAIAGSGAELFFGAGALLLVAGILLALAALRRLAHAEAGLESIAGLGARNAARRRGRSLATIAVLASGVFMVVAVDSFRQRPQSENSGRDSGTGGFALVGESALPVYEDLNSVKGREAFALDAAALRGVTVVPARVRDGDDASCLNLNRALQPRLLGIKPGELESRHAFRLVSAQPGGWLGLSRVSADGAVSGVADENTLRWALQKKVGDTIDYRDEQGRPFAVRIDAVVKGSLLQGSIVIAENAFIEKFPGQGGYRYFLIDAPAGQSAEVEAYLSRALQDRGLELTAAWRRLAGFQAVENTYLSIFQVLGGLGLLLGTVGLAIVVGRNVLERRSEFGLLEALGFEPRQLRQLIFAEHRWLIICGLLTGAGSALLAVWPGLRERTAGFPVFESLLLLAALTAGCLFWTWLATRIALRGSRIGALRRE